MDPEIPPELLERFRAKLADRLSVDIKEIPPVIDSDMLEKLDLDSLEIVEIAMEVEDSEDT